MGAAEELGHEEIKFITLFDGYANLIPQFLPIFVCFILYISPQFLYIMDEEYDTDAFVIFVIAFLSIYLLFALFFIFRRLRRAFSKEANVSTPWSPMIFRLYQRRRSNLLKWRKK